jgi:hypothetical protein
MKTNIIVAASLITLMSLTVISAQPKGIHVNIPFQFTAENKLFPAGHYDFAPELNNEAIRIINLDKGPSGIVLVLTRLGLGIHTTEKDDHVVFDKLGNNYTLSELWYRGADGFLVTATKGNHEHKMIDVPN